MSSKIDCRPIIRDHLRTLHHSSSQRVSPLDLFLFYLMPLAVSVLLRFVWHIKVSTELAGIMATSLSVFAALLFTLVLFVYEIAKREENAPAKKVLREIDSNIEYGILVTVVTLALVLVLYLLPIPDPPATVTDSFLLGVRAAIDVVVYFLEGNFLLTLLMVLKRTHILMTREYS